MYSDHSTPSNTVSKLKGPTPAVPSSDFYWKAITRFDVYIGATNTRAAFLITWNTFLIGLIVAKGAELTAQYSAYPKLVFGAYVLFLIAVIAALASLYHTFQVVNPFSSSHKAPGVYHSAIFFEHVAEYEAARDYFAATKDMTDEQVCLDLASQAHALAKGLTGKYVNLRKVMNCIIFVEFPTMAAILIIHVGVAIWKTQLAIAPH